jgi:DNA-binding IscR family transcriptional regulator
VKGGGYYLIKDPKVNMAKVYRFLKAQSHYCLVQPMKMWDCKDEVCAVRVNDGSKRDNTLKILENNSLADIAF